MYKFIQSKNLKLLADILAGSIAKNRPDDPLKPVVVIVPNRDMANWLTPRLAERLGIAANLDYKLPSEWFWSQVRNIKPDLPGLLPSDLQPMCWSVFYILREPDKLEQLPELNDYLEKQPGFNEIYIYQLAVKISTVFDEYQMYRPGMLMQWEKGDFPAGTNRWQGVLWKFLIEHWKNSGEPEARNSRAKIFNEALSQADSEQWPTESSFYIFNPGLLPGPIHKSIRQMSYFVDIYHYHLSCLQGAYGIHHQNLENEILQELGDQQVEIHQIQNRLAAQHQKSYQFTELETASNSESKTLLESIKSSIFSNTPTPDFYNRDSSIEVHSCHSPLREVETLKNYLVGIFSNENGITPDDILVVTPDLQAYSPYIEAVFGTEEDGIPTIPFQLPTGTSSGQTDLHRAFVQFIQLLSSRFYKNDIVDFLKNRSVSDKFKLSDTDIRKISGWLDENRVLWGIDAEHRKEFDLNDDNQHTWEGASQRGWLGQLMATQPGEIHKEKLLFAGVESSDDKKLWAELCYFMDLLGQARNLSKLDQSAEGWKMILLKWVDDLFPEERDYETDIEQLYKRINRISDEIKTGGFPAKISFELIRLRVIEKLEASISVTGSYSRGVQFQSMVPARSIPFKIIATIGLNDEHFPRQSRRPEFDLMASDPLPGERDRKKEDRNLFLESILSAGQRHYSSFIGKSIKDNEPLPPSPILYKWISFLESITTESKGDFTVNQKLNGFSSSYFKRSGPGSYSSAYLEAADLIQHAEKIDGWIVDEPIPDDESFESGNLSLNSIENFFSNPVKSFFSERLNIRLPDYRKEEGMEFSLDGLSRYILFQHLFGWVIQGYENEAIERLLLRSGQLPAGWPGRRKLAEMITSVRQAMEEIHSRGFLPELNRIQIDLPLRKFRISGSIQSYSEPALLDLHPSKESGKRMLKSWIRHLTICIHTDNPGLSTTVFTGYRSDDQKWVRFRYAENAVDLYANLLECYRSGISNPVNLYIDSGYAYQKSISKDGDQENAMNAALKTWNNEYSNFTESQDPYIQLLSGTEPELDPDDLIRSADLLYTPLIQHMEEI